MNGDFNNKLFKIYMETPIQNKYNTQAGLQY